MYKRVKVIIGLEGSALRGTLAFTGTLFREGAWPVDTVDYSTRAAAVNTQSLICYPYLLLSC